MGLFEILFNFALLLAGWAIPQLWNRFVRQMRLRSAGYVFPTVVVGNEDPTIHLRASFDEIMFGTNPPTLRGYTHSGDVQGIMSIVEFFDDLPVQIDFDYFPEVRDDMKNIVIVGSSSRSDVSRDLGAELVSMGIRVRGDGEHAHYKDKNGNIYRCEHIEVGGRMIVSKDVGVIFRKVTDSGAVVLLCAGIHTFGSQAAADVALSAEFQRKIRKSRTKQFIQLLTVDVATGGNRAGLALVRTSIRWKDFPLMKLDKR